MQQIALYWERLRRLPGGPWLFSKGLGLFIPYTGSIDSRVETVAPGYARVRLPDRRSVRNHLRSVHAIALANLAELTGNLAMLYAMPPDARFIVTALSVEYIKKARGTVIAEAHCPVPQDNQRRAYDNPVVLHDLRGDTVATAVVRTLVGPRS